MHTTLSVSESIMSSTNKGGRRMAEHVSGRNTTIAVSSPAFLGREAEYLGECIADNWITQGPFARRFEDTFARFCGVDYALTCSSGTSALHLALKAIGTGPSDAVFVPALTYVATANAVKYCGTDPMFVDVDLKTWCMDPKSLRRKIELARDWGWNLRAIIAVHLFGVPAPMTELRALANEFDMVLIEDAAQAHGAEYDGRVTGSLADIGTFSFYGNKIITCGEGGMVTTDDKDIADKVALYRAQGVRDGHTFNHSVVGFNYRMTDMAAAVGLAQLESFNEHETRRRFVRQRYTTLLGNDPRFTFQEIRVGTKAADWLVSCLLPTTTNRDDVIINLAERGIESRPFFVPIPALPMYDSDVPVVAQHVAARGISLPTHAKLSIDDVERVCEALKECVQ